MWPTNLTLSTCWEIEKARREAEDKNVIVGDDRVGKGTSVRRLPNFPPCSPLVPQSPPWLQRMSDRFPHYHCLQFWAALEHCDQAGGSQLSFCYSFPSSAISLLFFHLSLSLCCSVSIFKSWGCLKYLQAFGQFNLENICDLLTSDVSLSFSHLLFLCPFWNFWKVSSVTAGTLYFTCYFPFTVCNCLTCL